MTRMVVMLGALAACEANPSLRVEVTHHPDAAEVVARTTITVYESDLVSCSKVELGDLTAAELTAVEVDQIAIGAGEDADALTMSREGTKVIVARGFDDNGVLLAAGCAEHGLVGEGDVLPITTELAASVSVNGIGLEDADPFGIVVTVTDPFVRSLPDRVVSWRVHGSDGVAPLTSTGLEITDSEWVPTAPPCTNDNGIVRVHPVPPSTIGGFATAVRTSWSVEPPRVFTTFTPIDGTGALTATPVTDGNSISQRRCAMRISGQARRLVCLEDRAGTPTAVDYSVSVVNGGAVIREQAIVQSFPGLTAGEVPLNVFAIDRGPSTRDVYLMTSRARSLGVFSPSIAADPTPKLVSAIATDVAVLPSCGSNPLALLVRVENTVGKELRTLAVSATASLGMGEMLQPYASPAVGIAEGLGINSTGCVAELTSGGEPIVHQVGVVDVFGRSGPVRNATAAFFDCNAGMCTIPLAVPRAGVGFLPADATHPERMVGATFDASGTILSVTVLQPDNSGKLRPVEQERITAASFPQHVVTGQFDADGRPDLFWDLGNPNTATTNFQLSYAHPVLGERLSALSATQQDVIVVDTFVADVDGDGHDDLVISSQDRVVNPTSHRVLVLPGQVDIPATNLQPDPSCIAP